MDGKYQQILNYLSKGAYPEDFNKMQKQVLRRSCKKFKVIDGKLFYDSTRQVVKTKEDAFLLFLEHHESPMGGHSGMVKTRSVISSRYYWSGMSVDIDKWVVKCDFCQRTGGPIHTETSLKSIKVSRVWELLAMDLIGPFPQTSRGHRYIMTVTDYFSKWVAAFPIKTKTAVEVAENIADIIYRHGCPKRILSDQGREFVNQINFTLCKTLQIQRSVTAAYHPQTNGLDEKTNSNIQRALRKLGEDRLKNSDLYLNPTLFSLRSK